MATNPDQPVPLGDNEPQEDNAPTHYTERDRMVSDILLGLDKEQFNARLAGTREAQTRAFYGMHMPVPMRGIVKGATRVGESVVRYVRNFPSFGLGRMAACALEQIAPQMQYAAVQEVRSFFDVYASHELSREIKIAAREQRQINPNTVKEIQARIIAEQPRAEREVVRQERTMEYFRRALESQDYERAACMYRDVLDYVSSSALEVEAADARKLQARLARNAKRKKGEQEPEAAIENRTLQDEGENMRRNWLLQKYLRMIAARHIADLASGRYEGDEHARFFEMFRNFAPIQELSPNDVPLPQRKIDEFLFEQKDAIGNLLVDTMERHGRPNVMAAVHMGIFTKEEACALHPDMGQYIVEREREINQYATDRAQATYESIGLVRTEHVTQSTDIRQQAFQDLRNALQQDIRDNVDSYRNFDAARNEVLLRPSSYPTAEGEPHQEWKRRVQAMRDVLAKARQRLAKNEHDENAQEDVRLAQKGLRHLLSAENPFLTRNILSPGEITVLLVERNVRASLRNQLVLAFERGYDHFVFQRDALTRVRDDTYAPPYRLMMEDDFEVAMDTIRDGPARQRLASAARQGHDALELEEQRMIKLDIFTPLELIVFHSGERFDTGG